MQKRVVPKKSKHPIPHFFYELRPYAYLGLGAYGVWHGHVSDVTMASGLILLYCAWQITHWRVQYRRSRHVPIRVARRT